MLVGWCLSALWSYVLIATHPAGSAAQTFRCEYLDLVIPLNANSLVPGLVLQDQCEGRAHAALAGDRLTGWQAEDPTGWASIRRTGRLKGR